MVIQHYKKQKKVKKERKKKRDLNGIVKGKWEYKFEGFNILANAKQMLQRFPIALAQVKGVNTYENLLNEIRKIIYPLYQAKEVDKKVYNNTMNSRKL